MATPSPRFAWQIVRTDLVRASLWRDELTVLILEASMMYSRYAVEAG